ncbi:hypothetical protein [Nonomuraea soli]|uniref:Uncharacterized protein n=1 Tax=Nonomuraea soli TaxID=1032476 RepID=A0A7W0HW01_9ACTN|nr:hypothetical protein [Nonomuraea soli]MBA2897728.1 hypothetical protein [Nonomuraea soli]
MLRLDSVQAELDVRQVPLDDRGQAALLGGELGQRRGVVVGPLVVFGEA